MKQYSTPHRSRVVKTRLTDEEYADFAQRLSAYNISQSEFLREAITKAVIRPVITVSSVKDELLSAVGKLTAKYGKIGGNLNQIARFLNECGLPHKELRAAVAQEGQPIKQSKFETDKVKLRQMIRTATCTAHFIRTDLLKAGVTANLRKVTGYAEKHEKQFMKLLIEQNKDCGKRRNNARRKELLPTLLREFVEEIIVHKCSHDEDGTRRQNIENYYSFVDKIDLTEA